MNNLSDIISGADLISDSPSYFNLTCDRFNNSNSSVYIISYLNIPLTVIVSTDFTLTLWIRLTSSLISNLFYSESIQLMIINQYVTFKIFSFGQSFQSVTSLQLNRWYHLAFVLNATVGYIYINGIQDSNRLLLPKPFGPFSSLKLDNAIYDDIKIYNYKLTATEIMNDFKISSLNGKF
jgi:hypothetical protein